ncbi:CheR family methyltransferase [Thioclava pacifica]|uniref:Chemotaxis protein methyltransferase n=1 Tax=Thioclava pacifica DSM 10166 TaxID=1353537 RepID=A0A074J5E9_9RHOB|nr:protein-glutamate O-methyltransferase [Thioclava pacifica]KEO51754.1 hypothetical protein TP2_09760 [Thioclava pacifica DSM 10166]
MSTTSPNLGQLSPAPDELEIIARILHDATGIVIAPGKSSMVQSRLGKRLRALGINDYASYIAHVTSQGGVDERRNMISALTTNVTHFFRENHHFETLRATAMPPLLERARAGQRIRIWSAGSSNGQEAYSIAMIIAEAAPDYTNLDVRILASDIDPQMVAAGATGIYEEAALASVPIDLQRKYFSRTGEQVQIVAPLRNLVSFRELNLHERWPMRGQFDIIFCRNVVIYFAPDAQTKLWRRFETQLAPDGWLFVGHSERISDLSHSNLVNAGVTTYRLSAKTTSRNTGQWH